MHKILTVRDIARLVDRNNSVVSRWRRAKTLNFPAPDTETLGGSPLWKPETIRAWLAERRPELETVFTQNLTR